jgi:6-phosphogluconolactonase
VRIEILADAEDVARKGADLIAVQARAAITQRGRFVMAVSGGHTPWVMLRALADEQLPWKDVHVFQVDERIAPANDPDRNLTHLRASLLDHSSLGADQVHAMPVESVDLEAAAGQYARTLQSLAGTPAILDLVHLGLGPDGHTASLVPEDPVLGVTDADVALTQIYQGRRRMTLTYPVIDRSRCILWLVTGTDKAAVLPRLCAGDRGIPAGRVRRDNSVLLADRAAAKQLPANNSEEAST